MGCRGPRFCFGFTSTLANMMIHCSICLLTVGHHFLWVPWRLGQGDRRSRHDFPLLPSPCFHGNMHQPSFTTTREKNLHAKQTTIARTRHRRAASAEAARGQQAPSQLELAPVLAIQCCRLARQVPQAARAAGVDGHAAALRKLRRVPPVFSETSLFDLKLHSRNRAQQVFASSMPVWTEGTATALREVCSAPLPLLFSAS